MIRYKWMDTLLCPVCGADIIYHTVSKNTINNAICSKCDWVYDRKHLIISESVSQIESDRFEYKGFLLQRLNKDYLWYVIKDNQIVNWSQYRNDMTSWIDSIKGLK